MAENSSTKITSNQKCSQRNITFDIAKGIGIMLVVMGHTNCPAKSFIYLFHVALFFMISGYFIKTSASETFSNVIIFVKKSIKRLYIPYIIINITLLLLNNFLIDINLYTNNPLFLEGNNGNKYGLTKIIPNNDIIMKCFWTILMVQCSQLAGATWFLRVLLYICIAYTCVNYLLLKLIKDKKIYEITRFIICVSCLVIGYYLHKIDFNYMNIGTAFTTIFILYLGILYKNIENKIILGIKTFTISSLILLICWFNNHAYLQIAANSYGSIIRLILTSVFGFIFILCISQFISKSKTITDVMSYIGQNTMPILCLHFVCFKFVTALQVHIYHLPSYRLASFPVYINTGLWWLFYVIIGIVGPLLLSFIYSKIKQFILETAK